jgi:alpha-tubulin suppressor-like RCC1 family protein
MRLQNLALSFIGLLPAACGAVDPAQSPMDETATGDVTAELYAVPSGVQCIRITSTQAVATSKTFTVTTTSSVGLSVGKLPLGPTTFKAEAFNVACASVTTTTSPDWMTPQAVSATVVLGVNTNVALVLRPNVSNTAIVDFETMPTKIVAGEANTYALMPDGSVKAWGGATAMGDGLEHLVPTDIASLATFGMIAAGQNHSCGIRGGQLYCWGNNVSGAFGNGTTTSSATPVIASTATGNNWSDIAVGSGHTCILNTAGNVYCAGQGSYGQLGFGGTTAQTSFVYAVGSVARIAAGLNHTCAAHRNGMVTCWGENSYGQLGDGTTVSKASPVTVQVPSGIVDLSLGGLHSCARAVNGRAFCWGYNGVGQLADGTTTNRSVPVLVPGVGLGAGGGIKMVAAGRYHTCFLDGTDVSCAGYSVYGQLGFMPASYASQYSAVALTVASGVTDLVAVNHTCAVYGRPDLAGAPANTIRCWGDNSSGQLGDGSKNNRFAPTAVFW